MECMCIIYMYAYSLIKNCEFYVYICIYLFIHSKWWIIHIHSKRYLFCLMRSIHFNRVLIKILFSQVSNILTVKKRACPTDNMPWDNLFGEMHESMLRKKCCQNTETLCFYAYVICSSLWCVTPECLTLISFKCIRKIGWEEGKPLESKLILFKIYSKTIYPILVLLNHFLILKSYENY